MAQLLQAEGVFKDPGYKLLVWQGDRLLPDSALLHPGTKLTIEARQKAQARTATVAPRGGAAASVTPSLPPTLAAGPSSPPSLPGLHDEPPSSCLLLGTPLSQRLPEPWNAACPEMFSASSCALVPPLSMQDALKLLSSTGSTLCRHFASSDQALLLVPFLTKAHWALLILTARDGALQGRLFDSIPGRSHAAAAALLDAGSTALQRPATALVEEHHWIQHDNVSCDAYVLAHAAAFLSGSPSPRHITRALDFLRGLPALLAGLVGFGGLSLEQQASLAEILQDRGVPQAEVATGIQAAVAKLGAAPIAQALQSKVPWQGLKTAASKPGSSLRWILPPEQEGAHCASRSATFWYRSAQGEKQEG